MFGKSTMPHTEDYLYTLYDNFAHNFFHNTGRSLPDFRADILDEGAAYVLEAELPGFQKSEIQLTLQGHTLTINAVRPMEGRPHGIYVLQERKVESFSRTFDVSGTDEDKFSAAFENGILRVTMPKSHASAAWREIEIG